MTNPVPSLSINALAAEAAAGRLRLSDDVAAVCTQACDDLLDRLNQIRSLGDRMSTTSAYGILRSAQQLGAKFESKAIGPGGLRDVLQHHIDTVTQLRDLFDKAGRAYRDADESAARMIAETG